MVVLILLVLALVVVILVFTVVRVVFVIIAASSASVHDFVPPNHCFTRMKLTMDNKFSFGEEMKKEPVKGGFSCTWKHKKLRSPNSLRMRRKSSLKRTAFAVITMDYERFSMIFSKRL